jgi:hypothetical protein
MPKITAKGRISSNPYTANQNIAQTREEQTSQELKELKSDLETEKTQGQNLKVSFSRPAPLQVQKAQSASSQPGGAVYGNSPDQLQGIPVIADEAKRLSNISFLGYSYSLDGAVTGFIGSNFTAVDATAEVYLTIGYFNYSWFYDFSINGTDDKTKWTPWNSFLVGYMDYDSSNGVIKFSKNTPDFTEVPGEKIQGNISWINTLDSRPIDTVGGTGSGIDFYDFTNFDSTKITEKQFNQFIKGEIPNLKIGFGVRTDDLTFNQSGHLVTDVFPVTTLAPALEFYGTSIISNFN